MNILPGNMRFGAGQPVKRLEDQRLLTGKGQFIDDRPEDGALWLHVLRSPNAHAKFWSIDVKSAAEMPGIEAVYAGADLIADNVGTSPRLSVFKRRDGWPMTVPPRRLLAREIVRFAGEPVAAVVATSRIAAQTAAEAIAVEYEVLPSVVDPLEATKPGAPAVWAEAPDNIVAAMSYGDAAAVEAAFAKAAHKVSLDLVSQRLIPSAMEPRSRGEGGGWAGGCAGSAVRGPISRVRARSFRWCSGPLCSPACMISRWCITRSRLS